MRTMPSSQGRPALVYLTIGFMTVMASAALACAAPLPPPTPATSTPEVAQNTTSPGPTAAARATPTSTASALPSPTIVRTPTPAGLHVDGLARVIVDRLRQLADPEQPRSHAFESPLAGMATYLVPLHRDDEVFLVDGPRRVEGREFWKVATDAFVGCCAPLGWIPTTSPSGDPAIEPITLECPDASETFVAFLFPSPSRLGALSCFGMADLHVRGVLTCSQPTVDAPYFLRGAPWLENSDQPRLCDLADDPVYPFSVYGEPVTALLDAPNYGGYYKDFVELTGHFDDPASNDCFWTPGNLYVIDTTDAPTDTAQFTCRTKFVVTAVESI